MLLLSCHNSTFKALPETKYNLKLDISICIKKAMANPPAILS